MEQHLESQTKAGSESKADPALAKAIYVLHVPKCGGTTVSVQLRSRIFEYDQLAFYGQVINDKKLDLNNYKIIQGHFGNYPISKISNIDTVFLARNPVDRSLSNFAWLMMNNVFENNINYTMLNSIQEKLKYYLFEDLFYSEHNNLQSRHLCNGIEECVFNYKYNFRYLNTEEKVLIEKYKNNMMYINKTQNWYIQNNNTNYGNVKEQIEKVKILGTTEKVNQFIDEVYILFAKYNPNKLVKNLDTIKNHKHNESKIILHNQEIKTKDLKNMLSKKELSKIEENNSLDMQLWEYVNSML